MPKAIIIGSGIAGIASAIRLAAKGYQTDVFEANPYPGGKLTELKLGDFRFDAGPSLFTMPQYVDELFLLAGKNPKDYFTYQKLDEVCRYFWDDGTCLNATSDIDKFAKEIADNTSSSAQEIKKFFKKSSTIYDITHEVFLEKSLHQLSTYLRLNTAKSFLRFHEIDAFRTMASANASFFNDPKMVQYANRFATYNGSSPYLAPATLNVIPHLEQNFGAYFPKNGMHDITLSLVKLAEDLGVKFHYEKPVDEIIVENKKVKGIMVDGNFIESSLVISNMDVYFTYKKLMKDESQPKKILKQERSSSALIFYWGIKREFKQLGLHNIFFSNNYKEEFEHIFTSKTIYNDPTVYINISSKIKTDDAPENAENWFTMINVPNNIGQNWEDFKQQARENIIKKINDNLKVDIEELIVVEDVLDPVLIESRTSSYRGSLYGTSSNNQFAAFLRHANFSKKIKGLYFTGGSVHPGGGIPLALLSAKIVSEMIATND
ncbi:MAG: 1-hydroxycarotenoid 3,4-desaturase CrtD [Pelobium sp.]